LVTVIAAAGWGFSKSALIDFPPYVFLALRFALAALLLSLFCWSDLKALNKTQFLKAFLTGLLLGLTMLVWIIGLDKTDSVGEGAFIVSLTVVVVPIIGRLFFADKLSLNHVLALFPAVAGLFLLSLRTQASGEFVFVLETTHLLFLCSTIGFAFHVILTSRYAKSIPTLPLSTVQLIAIAVVATVAALLTEGWPADVSAISWFWLICSAAIATSLRFSLQIKAMAHLQPSHSSMIFMLEPVWTSVLGIVFLHELMLSNQIWGCVLIFCSLLIYRLSSLKALKRLFPGSIYAK